ncbi:MAG: hypothetical protein B7X31_02430 [Thiomonas sp. 13-66-29]|uniref:Uncharacterized protein n=1 Tax=Thiomonas delicata TaxID=364030 RepID=A0A238D6X9_THIDL|nr:MAG: hypothetical protein B7X46_09965 [Thiomonas sp. 15-66-11]OZB65131.1 MAG: hypothetical protein B7X31_02430 [Thiomonas sp. 13-66-29]SBP88910.1 hypothetical protein THIARS_70530 [Thiomonas delicata]
MRNGWLVKAARQSAAARSWEERPLLAGTGGAGRKPGWLGLDAGGEAGAGGSAAACPAVAHSRQATRAHVWAGAGTKRDA